MMIGLILIFAGILLFQLLYSPYLTHRLRHLASSSGMKLEEAGLEVFAHDLQLRGEARQHG